MLVTKAEDVILATSDTFPGWKKEVYGILMELGHIRVFILIIHILTLYYPDVKL